MNQINYDELEYQVAYNKNGKPNRNSLKKKERIDKAIEVLKRYDGDESLVFHHMSMLSGSVPRTNICVVRAYHGKYGEGITIDIPYSGNENKYFRRYYFIEKEGEQNGVSTS